MSRKKIECNLTAPSVVTAFALSYAINESILWAILHSFCGWFYVLYWLFSYTAFSEWVNSWVVR